MAPFAFVYHIGLLQAILLFAGLALLIAEMFFPGFGAAGITGIILLIIGILITAKSFLEALIMAAVLLVIIVVAIIILFHSAFRGRLKKFLVLPDSLKKDEGYTSVISYEHYIGREGIALTVLRPSGTAEFDGEILDVVTEGQYIPKNSKVKIVDVSGRRIVVRAIEE